MYPVSLRHFTSLYVKFKKLLSMYVITLLIVAAAPASIAAFAACSVALSFVTTAFTAIADPSSCATRLNGIKNKNENHLP